VLDRHEGKKKRAHVSQFLLGREKPPRPATVLRGKAYQKRQKMNFMSAREISFPSRWIKKVLDVFLKKGFRTRGKIKRV
jgi:hypothetical protein